MFKFALVPLAALLVAAAPPGPSPEEKAEMTASYQQIVQAQVQANQCNRDTNGLLLPISAALWQLEDTARLRYGEASAKALKDTPKPAALPCDNEEDLRQRIAADQTAFEYLTRLAVVMQANETPGWTQHIVEVGTLPGQLEAFRTQLGIMLVQIYDEQQIRQLVQQIGFETTTDLAMACEGRKLVRSATPRACPAIPAEFAAVKPIGAARIANLELLGQRFVQFGDNPFGVAWRHNDGFGSLLLGCDASAQVVYLKDPAAMVSGQQVILPLRVLSSGAIIEPVTLNMPKSNGSPPLIPPGEENFPDEKYERC